MGRARLFQAARVGVLDTLHLGVNMDTTQLNAPQGMLRGWMGPEPVGLAQWVCDRFPAAAFAEVRREVA